MANRYRVTLSKQEREQLTALAHCGKSSAARFIYARALLLCDVGEHAEGPPWKVAAVATALGISSRTIEHLKERFVEEGLEAALARKPQRKPRSDILFDGRFDARLSALACSKAPDGYQRWTLRLLADKLVELNIVDSISVMSVQRSLKKTSCALT